MNTYEVKWRVRDDRREQFEEAIMSVFVPAVSKQPGFRGYTLARQFADEDIQAAELFRDLYNFRLNLTFESEELRKRWATTPEHDHAVETALAIADELVACGFLVVAEGIQP